MADYLVINSTTFPTATDGRGWATPIRGGGVTRAYDNTALISVGTDKAVGDFLSRWLTDAEWTTQVTAINSANPATVTGSSLQGSSITAWVVYETAAVRKVAPGTQKRRMALHVEQV